MLFALNDQDPEMPGEWTVGRARHGEDGTSTQLQRSAIAADTKHEPVGGRPGKVASVHVTAQARMAQPGGRKGGRCCDGRG